jgi:hypothetical protein
MSSKDKDDDTPPKLGPPPLLYGFRGSTSSSGGGGDVKEDGSKHVNLFVPRAEGGAGPSRAGPIAYDLLLVRAVDEFGHGMGTHGMPVSLLQLLTDSCLALPSKPNHPRSRRPPRLCTSRRRSSWK